MQSVIYSHFNDLRRKKAATEGRDISIRTVAKETKLAQATVQRLASQKAEGVAGVRLSTIETLCRYFGVGVGDLIEYRAD